MPSLNLFKKKSNHQAFYLKPKWSDFIFIRRKVVAPAPAFADGVRKPRLSIGGTFLSRYTKNHSI